MHAQTAAPTRNGPVVQNDPEVQKTEFPPRPLGFFFLRKKSHVYVDYAIRTAKFYVQQLDVAR